MTHGFEHQIAQAADDSLAPEFRQALDVHLETCDACRVLLAEQREIRAVLMARPVVAVRDLSAAVRAALEAERPWMDRLNINWRVWSLRVAPLAAALTLIAVLLVRSGDSGAAGGDAVAPSHTVASALWSGEVDDDQLVSLFLQARPDDPLSTYVQEK
jgi:anti-sigma factor RsiW